MPSNRKLIASVLRRVMKHSDATPNQLLKASILLGKLNGYFDMKEAELAGRPDTFDLGSLKHLLDEENDGKD